MIETYLYPQGWAQLSREIRELCDWRCQACGKLCRRPGEFYLGWEYELTVAHLDQCYDGEVVTVAALCALCHFRMDAPFVWWARRRHERIRRALAGQLELNYR